ncbi:LysR family transcriptional regulator, partial [Rhizobium ruizarguesonis]
HRMGGFRSSCTGSLLPLEFIVYGAVANSGIPATVAGNAAESYISAARLGRGMIQSPRYHAEKELAEGTLGKVRPDVQ